MDLVWLTNLNDSVIIDGMKRTNTMDKDNNTMDKYNEQDNDEIEYDGNRNETTTLMKYVRLYDICKEQRDIDGCTHFLEILEEYKKILDVQGDYKLWLMEPR